MTTTDNVKRPTKITGSIWHYSDSWLVRLKTDDFRDFSFKIDNHMSNRSQISFRTALRAWFDSDCTIAHTDEVREAGCFHSEGIFEITTKGHMQYAMQKAFDIFEWATAVISKWTLDQIVSHEQVIPCQYITAEETDGRIKVYIHEDGVKSESVSSHQVMEAINNNHAIIIYPSPAIAVLETKVMWGGDATNRTKYLGSIGSREPWVIAWYWSNILRANANKASFGWTADGIECHSDIISNDMPA